MSLHKFVAVTAVAACAGGGVILTGGVSGSAPSTPVVLEHFLCADHHSRGCDPVQVELPDSTTFAVTDAGARLDCHRSFRRHHHHHDSVATTAAITNELTNVTVPLAIGNRDASCAVEQGGQRLATFSCYDVTYLSDSAVRFTPPNPLTVDGHYNVTVGDPTRLCVPDDPTAASATNASLVCFAVQITDRSNADPASRHRRHRGNARPGTLCVPSTDSVVTQNPTTTTTTTSTSQPCAGQIINGKCVING